MDGRIGSEPLLDFRKKAGRRRRSMQIKNSFLRVLRSLRMSKEAFPSRVARSWVRAPFGW
jgi:hypothetical protein